MKYQVKIDELKSKLIFKSKQIKCWLDACNMASADDTHPLLSRAIYSAMDNVEDTQEELNVSGTDAFELVFQGSVESCIDDAEGMYGDEFLRGCINDDSCA